MLSFSETVIFWGRVFFLDVIQPDLFKDALKGNLTSIFGLSSLDFAVLLGLLFFMVIIYHCLWAGYFYISVNVYSDRWNKKYFLSYPDQDGMFVLFLLGQLIVILMGLLWYFFVPAAVILWLARRVRIYILNRRGIARRILEENQRVQDMMQESEIRREIVEYLREKTDEELLDNEWVEEEVDRRIRMIRTD